MSRRRRNRSIAPGALASPENGLALDTPEGEEDLMEREDDDATPPGTYSVPYDAKPTPAADPPRSPEGLRARLSAARALKPGGSHWLSMWQAGRDAVVVAIEKGASMAQARAMAAPDGSGCRDCWGRGKDAALEVIEGE